MTEYSLPIVPRFAEIDQQSVVFNAHYLTWFDEAVTGYLDHLGTSYPDLMSAGLDMQLVHTEIDYAAPVRWRDSVRVAVACEHVGTTSFRIGFSVLRRRDGSEELVAVRGRNVYVVVSTDDWTKRSVPEALRRALSRPAR
ncbi:thioesterase family protein [Mycobacterium sp. 1274761.0]|uniref:acyl-CoA thioesterase n=1 Tax=Mycobacterium sp. 1274761.0 TaxID=1834077 RepID=UPI000801837C|nr:thioesterase family protein [Mycobacterium sp. 1274761.0]OBK76731.1 4-hydroxybenzoyl-CoA thioesterase [Mycobacterium sp. 1274761.0]